MDKLPQQISAQLTQFIVDKIQAKGGISFADFMHLALYQPGLGYYAAGSIKFGAQGDFVTAPEISSLFSKTLAQYYITHHAGKDILEFGAGSGRMALDVLQHLALQNALPQRYCIIEVSPDLLREQQRVIQESAPHLFERVVWLNTLPPAFEGVVFANEVLDAMPVEIFKIIDQQVHQAFVIEGDNGLQFEFRPAAPFLQQAVVALGMSFSEGYQSEINVMVEPWLQSVADSIVNGEILLIDYGYLKEQYYHPSRYMGTLLCHYQHQVVHNPLVNIGLQDITAHVDFSSVISAAERCHFSVNSFQTQAEFLLKNDMLSFMPNPEDTIHYFNAAQQVKRLTLPQEMGESFKVLSLSK